MAKKVLIIGLLALLAILGLFFVIQTVKFAAPARVGVEHQLPRFVPSPQPEVPTPTEEARKLVWTATLELEVEDFDKAYYSLRDVAERRGGYVVEVRSELIRGRREGQVVIRVPAIHFHDALVEVKRLGKLLREEVKGKDVTEEYIDLRARLEARKSLEKRLLELLQRAVGIKDVLEVERELDRVRAEIEKLDGRLRVMEELIEMATITVRLKEPLEKEVVQILPEVDWMKTLAAGLQGAAILIQVGVVLLVASSPLILLVAVGWLIYKKVKSR